MINDNRVIVNGGLSYAEAIETTFTRSEVAREVRDHGIDPEEFFSEVGNKETYIGEEVLNWLGY